MPRRPATKPLPRIIDTQKRVRLPDDVMEALGVDSGDHVGFEVDGDEARVFSVNACHAKRTA